ncbi:MAG: HEAT repeat domain-containing protein [Planctomycetaceae bacterium]|nr:HEAT repeat domain-containing protein [Planctomycetaceae bacterium]
MTACYAKDRRSAIHKLGNRYNCCCNPEIMNAFVYALNDSDERVRTEAADEIGDQIRKNKCCCSPCVVAALTCSLADCDRSVRRQAEEALEACGYEIVDGCCNSCGDTCCHDGGCTAGGCTATPVSAPVMVQPQPTPAGDVVPAPAPPEDPQAFFPSRLHNKSQAKTKSSLAGLFGMAR